MFATDDTIVAVATPYGRGAIGVVRLSGAHAWAIGQALVGGAPLQPRVARFARALVVHANASETRDEVLVVGFKGPRSFTGEDTVEISAHGSPLILEGIVRAAVGRGARLARPGEFTLRAFLNGKRDLLQAEAVADLVAATTPAQVRSAADQIDGTLTGRIAGIDAQLFDLLARLEASLDFPDEGYHFIEASDVSRRISEIARAVDDLLAGAARGRMIREGATVAIVGRPNAGKSSLFNALLGVDRAIVHEVPGTTRDLVSERVDVEGLALTLIDTAGSRETADVVEREGVARGIRAADAADLVLVVVDQSDAVTEDDRRVLAATAGRPRIVVRSKADRPDRMGRVEAIAGAVPVSAKTGEGLTSLRQTIVARIIGSEPLSDVPPVTNLRHIDLLNNACTSLRRADASAASGASEEFVVADLQAARARLDEIVGARTAEDVLRHIFERFCIGK